MTRIIYLGYYLKKINWNRYRKFLNHTAQISGKSKFLLSWESIICVFKYNISILEYFQFGFYCKSHAERKEWAGTGTMYEFQKAAKPISERNILDDKRLFYKNYKEFFVYMQKHEAIHNEFEQGMKLDYIRDVKSNPSNLFTVIWKNNKKTQETAHASDGVVA